MLSERFTYKLKEQQPMTFMEEFGHKVEQQNTNQEVAALAMRVEALAAQVAALQATVEALSQKIDAQSQS
jgi:predicted  nucleic acid-binding Zn-ribbon protein